MDTVTESSMAIAMALEGGIGIVHRFLGIEDQVQKVLRVKRSQSIIIENPYTCSLHSTLKDARSSMEANSINSLLVTMPDATLAGILTNRDIQFEHDVEKRVSELMTKRDDLIAAKVGIALDEARKILRLNKIEKLPLVDDQFRLKGLITAKDMMKRETHTRAAKDSKGRLLVGAAIGVRDGFLERAEALIRAGCDALVIDIAHDHADQTIKAINAIRENLGNVDIIAGNVATGEGAKDLIEAGADAIKVGVGPGTVCITRMVTGCGVPQLTAVMDVVHVAKGYDVPVIADGGIQKPGDVVKALAAGGKFDYGRKFVYRD